MITNKSALRKYYKTKVLTEKSYNMRTGIKEPRGGFDTPISHSKFNDIENSTNHKSQT